MNEIEEILRSADRPRELTTEELGRLRERLGVHDTATSAAAAGAGGSDGYGDHDAVIIELDGGGEQVSRHRRMALRVLAVAAALLVVVPLFHRATDDEVVEVGRAPTSSTLSAVETVCLGEISALADGMESWRGVGNWALTTNGQPDLGILASESLDALASLDTLNDRAETAQRALEDSLAQTRELPQSGAAATAARERAIRSALSDIVAIVESAGGGDRCDLDALRLAG